MPGSFRLGYEGVLYFANTILTGRPGDVGSPDTFANVTWTELDNVMDVDGQFESESVDTTTRAEAKLGWASEIKTTKKGTLSTTMRWRPGDAGFEKLRDAWLGNSEVALLDLDGGFGDAADEGNQGLVANFTVSFGQKKPVKGIMTVEVSLTISSFPNWVEVDSGGALVAV